MKDHHTIRQTISEIGLALILTFIPIGMYAKVYLGNMQIGNLLMVLGFLFVFPYRNVFFYKRRVKWPSNIKWFLSFFVLSFLYLFVSSTNDVSLEKEILYLGVSLGTCIALVYTKYEYDLKIDRAIIYTLILSLFCVICGLFFCMSGVNVNYIDQQEYNIYDDLTAGSISVINICCSLYLLYERDKRIVLSYLLFFLIALDLYHIILTGKRTPLIIGMLCVLYGLYIQIKRKKNTGINKIHIVIGVLIFFVIVLNNEVLYQSIINIFDSIARGLNDLIFGASYDDSNSTSIRYNARQDSIDDLATYSFIEYIFGRGYMYKWIDIPLLQAYMDMGILGFVLFAKNVIIVPFKSLIKYTKNNGKIMWATLICSYGMFGALTTGTPYDHGKWIYLAVLLFVLNGEKRIVLGK